MVFLGRGISVPTVLYSGKKMCAGKNPVLIPRFAIMADTCGLDQSLLVTQPFLFCFISESGNCILLWKGFNLGYFTGVHICYSVTDCFMQWLCAYLPLWAYVLFPHLDFCYYWIGPIDSIFMAKMKHTSHWTFFTSGLSERSHFPPSSLYYFANLSFFLLMFQYEGNVQLCSSSNTVV